MDTAVFSGFGVDEQQGFAHCMKWTTDISRTNTQPFRRSSSRHE
jgi:hypothetical protein